MPDTRDIKERIKDRVNQGLLGQWYAVAKSIDVQPGRPHGVKALGQKLVLWREPSGTLACLEDFCPHRGAPLSRGEVHETGVACRYHGVAVAGSGTIARVPAMSSGKIDSAAAAARLVALLPRPSRSISMANKSGAKLQLPRLTSKAAVNLLAALLLAAAALLFGLSREQASQNGLHDARPHHDDRRAL
ncbi:MAG: Rieske (2Fe-2S) protein [Devosia sp.]